MSTRPTSKTTSNSEEDSFESNLEETILAADTGTVTFRDYGNGEIWIGLHEDNDPNVRPRVIIPLTQRQQSILLNLIMDSRRLLCRKH
jgi:hypothetical protein